MRTGPTASTRSSCCPLAIASSSGSTTKPRRPWLPSSVITVSSSQAARISSCKTNSSRERAPSTPSTRLPAARSARATGRMIAAPTPPAIAITVPNRWISDGCPSGPATSRIASPTASEFSSLVVLPTPWTTKVIVPRSGSAPAIVRGMRSPWLCVRTMTNCPGRCLRAMRGAATSSRCTSAVNRSVATIGNMGEGHSAGRKTTRRRSMTATPGLVRGLTASVWRPAGSSTTPITRRIICWKWPVSWTVNDSV